MSLTMQNPSATIMNRKVLKLRGHRRRQTNAIEELTDHVQHGLDLNKTPAQQKEDNEKESILDQIEAAELADNFEQAEILAKDYFLHFKKCVPEYEYLEQRWGWANKREEKRLRQKIWVAEDEGNLKGAEELARRFLDMFGWNCEGWEHLTHEVDDREKMEMKAEIVWLEKQSRVGEAEESKKEWKWMFEESFDEGHSPSGDEDEGDAMDVD